LELRNTFWPACVRGTPEHRSGVSCAHPGSCRRLRPPHQAPMTSRALMRRTAPRLAHRGATQQLARAINHLICTRFRRHRSRRCPGRHHLEPA
jgi:hypothetical protein